MNYFLKKCGFAVLAGVICLAVIYLSDFKKLVKTTDKAVQDSIAEYVKPNPVRDDLLYLGIDTPTLSIDALEKDEFESIANQRAYNLMKQSWPWSREIHGRAVEKLIEAGAKLVILDILFLSQGDPEGDAYLERVINDNPGKVVLASIIASESGVGGHSGGQTRLVEPDWAFLGTEENETPLGFANFYPREDGLITHARLWSSHSKEQYTEPLPGEAIWQSLASTSAQQLGYIENVENYRREGKLRFPQLEGLQDVKDIYPAISFKEIFIDRAWQEQFKNGEAFKDKVIMVGPEAVTFNDKEQTVFGQISGPQLHLHALANIMNDSWLDYVEFEYSFQDRAFGFGLFIAFALALIGVALFKKLTYLIAWIALGVVTSVGVSYYLMTQDLMYSHFGALVLFTAVMVGGIYFVVIDEVRNRQQLQVQLGRSMSPEVAEAIVKAPDGYYEAAKGSRESVAILFSDIRGFTSKSEKLDVGTLVQQLNAYFDKMVDVVFEGRGTVDKFIGDALMATWGELGQFDKYKAAQLSVKAAKDMFIALEKLNVEAASKGWEPMHIGVGVHTGDVVVGEIGSKKRADFTVIGDVVNIASRVESLTSTLKLKALFTDDLVQLYEGNEKFAFVGKFQLKGKDRPIGLYTFEQGFESIAEVLGKALEGDSVNFLEQLDAIATTETNEGLISFYRNYFTSLDQPFNGVFRLVKK